MLPKVGLDPETFALVARDMQGAYVRGFGGNNARPSMVGFEVLEQPIKEAARLANVYWIPNRPELITENINAGTLKILDPNGMELELVSCPAGPCPSDAGRRGRSL